VGHHPRFLCADKRLNLPTNDDKVKRIISTAVACALLCGRAYGMEFRKEADQRHIGQFSILTGRIVQGDSNTFEKLATDGPHNIVFSIRLVAPWARGWKLAPAPGIAASKLVGKRERFW
jgi:hypothetical protein